MLLLEEAMKEEYDEPMNTSITRSNHEHYNNDNEDDDDDDENAITNSHSSDVERGSVFASSTYSRDDDDSPRLNRRQTTSSGDNNRDFELIEREIGMCRPVCFHFALIFFVLKNFVFSRKMVYVKFMY